MLIEKLQQTETTLYAQDKNKIGTNEAINGITKKMIGINERLYAYDKNKIGINEAIDGITKKMKRLSKK